MYNTALVFYMDTACTVKVMSILFIHLFASTLMFTFLEVLAFQLFSFN